MTAGKQRTTGEVKLSLNTTEDGYAARVCVPGGSPGRVGVMVALAEDFACGFELTPEEAEDFADILLGAARAAKDRK